MHTQVEVAARRRGRAVADRWLRGPDAAALLGVIAVGAIAASFALAVERTTFDIWAGVLVGVVLMVASMPLVLAAARLETDDLLRRLLPWALAAKVFAAVPRYLVVFAVYDGNADAETYHDAGITVAAQMRNGALFPHVEGATGTSFLKWLTGLVYVTTGPTRLGGFFVFAWFGFWGLWLFYRAFVTACPGGSPRRYFVLVFFAPSLLFWPSSIGKEAWMTFGLGLAAWGAARVLTHGRGGLIVLGLGLAATAAVRPHVAVILAVAAFSAIVLRRPPKNASVTSPLAKLAVILVMAVALIVVLNSVQSFFSIDTFNLEAVQQTRNRAARQTDEGGSAFDSGTELTDFSPSRFPAAVISVLFRPFPWEVQNAQALIASVEGMSLLVLAVASWRRIVAGVTSVVRSPYVLLCCVYALIFVYGFSSFSNFGVLTRQRVQVFPFVLVLLCIRPFRRSEGGWRSLLVAE